MYCDHRFFGSANNSSFKGCTHLRAPSWEVTRWLGEVCTHFTLCSCLAHSISGKIRVTKTQSCMSEENPRHPLIQWPLVLKMYENQLKLHVLDLIFFLDKINIYSLNLVCPLSASVVTNYRVGFLKNRFTCLY